MNNSNLRKQLLVSEIKLNKILDQEVTGVITRSIGKLIKPDKSV